MPVATWTIAERRDLLFMSTEYDLSDEQLHDLMGRIYGNTWRNATNPVRKKYSVKDIRDGMHSLRSSLLTSADMS